jgi:hypothetical protein
VNARLANGTNEPQAFMNRTGVLVTCPKFRALLTTLGLLSRYQYKGAFARIPGESDSSSTLSLLANNRKVPSAALKCVAGETARAAIAYGPATFRGHRFDVIEKIARHGRNPDQNFVC